MIKKRDGTKVEFDIYRIIKAIVSAMKDTESGIVDMELATKIANSIDLNKELSVEEIQDIVEKKLMNSSRKDVAKSYITYRQRRSDERLKNSEICKITQDIIDVKNLDLIKENANLNGKSFSGKRSKVGSEYDKWYTRKFMILPHVNKAIDDNYLHIHDLDQYFVGNHNCTFIPFGKLLNKGFNTGNGSVRRANSIETAMQLTAIIFQSQQNCQYGGVGANMIDYDLAPFVQVTFKKHFKKALGYLEETFDGFDKDICIDNSNYLKSIAPKSFNYALQETIYSTKQGAESLIHNLNTMNSRAGDQVPFTSINYGTCTSTEGRMVIKSLLEATIDGLGNGETPIFPIQIFKCKKEINLDENSPNFDLFKLAIECSSKRLYPNFVNIDAPYNLQYYSKDNPDTEISTMGCRSRVIGDIFGLNHCSGKGNISFNTINLVKIGIENKNNEEGFYKKLDEILDITLEALINRFEYQSKQLAESGDFLYREGVWENGESLKPTDQVGELLKHGSLAIGFIGLAECMIALYGNHHGEKQDVYEKALNIIKYMREYCDRKSNELNLNISLFATPAEGLSSKFTKKDKEIFGELKGITDKIYYTNSFHIPVYYNITAFKKIDLEAPFHELCNAGAIGYVELDGNARNNLIAFEKIVRYALSKDMTYFSINHPVDRCSKCKYEGIIGNQCPKCGITEEEVHFSRLRRITGYLVGTMDKWNSGKRAEEKDRVKHGV